MTYPITLLWPPDTRVALPDGWRRLADGRFEATYHDADELALCLMFGKIPLNGSRDPERKAQRIVSEWLDRWGPAERELFDGG